MSESAPGEAKPTPLPPEVAMMLLGAEPLFDPREYTRPGIVGLPDYPDWSAISPMDAEEGAW